MASARELQVHSLKEQGNACAKEQKYEEAMFYYTHAIKLDPDNYSLYSNRSFAFLKMHQYHYAMQDALETIRLKTDWSKGYFRKAEVESETFHFDEAFRSYTKALSLHPNEPTIMEAMDKTIKNILKERRADQQIPWLGAGVGIIVGVIVVIADYVFTNKPTLTHPLLMALLTISTAMVGFVIAKVLRYFLKCQRRSLLEPPMDLFPDYETDHYKSKRNNEIRGMRSVLKQRQRKNSKMGNA